jgi:hypothetical protein
MFEILFKMQDVINCEELNAVKARPPQCGCDITGEVASAEAVHVFE